MPAQATAGDPLPCRVTAQIANEMKGQTLYSGVAFGVVHAKTRLRENLRRYSN